MGPSTARNGGLVEPTDHPRAGGRPSWRSTFIHSMRAHLSPISFLASSERVSPSVTRRFAFLIRPYTSVHADRPLHSICRIFPGNMGLIFGPPILILASLSPGLGCQPVYRLKNPLIGRPSWSCIEVPIVHPRPSPPYPPTAGQLATGRRPTQIPAEIPITTLISTAAIRAPAW